MPIRNLTSQLDERISLLQTKRATWCSLRVQRNHKTIKMLNFSSLFFPLCCLMRLLIAIFMFECMFVNGSNVPIGPFGGKRTWEMFFEFLSLRKPLEPKKKTLSNATVSSQWRAFHAVVVIRSNDGRCFTFWHSVRCYNSCSEAIKTFTVGHRRSLSPIVGKGKVLSRSVVTMLLWHLCDTHRYSTRFDLTRFDSPKQTPFFISSQFISETQRQRKSFVSFASAVVVSVTFDRHCVSLFIFVSIPFRVFIVRNEILISIHFRCLIFNWLRLQVWLQTNINNVR